MSQKKHNDSSSIKVKRKSKNHLLCTLFDFISGAFGGIVQTLCVQPLDTIKLKRQTFPALYKKGTFDCFMTTWRTDGLLRGLYAGIGPAIMAGVLRSSILFATYGSVQHFAAHILNVEHSGDLPFYADAVSGGLAGSALSLIACPAELIKTKLQACYDNIRLQPDRVQEMGPWELTKLIYRKRGVRGLYKGLLVTNARDVPAHFAFFGGYESMRIYFTEANQTRHDIGPIKTMISGACGGILFWTSSFPMDVVKNRIQVNNLKESMITVGWDIWQKEGFTRLYRGYVVTIFRSIIASSVLVSSVEYTKRFLHKNFNT